MPPKNAPKAPAAAKAKAQEVDFEQGGMMTYAETVGGPNKKTQQEAPKNKQAARL